MRGERGYGRLEAQGNEEGRKKRIEDTFGKMKEGCDEVYTGKR